MQIINSLLQYPFVVGTLKQINDVCQLIWLGNIADYVGDDIIVPWSIKADKFFQEDSHDYSIQIPDFNPISLKYLYLQFALYLHKMTSYSLTTEQNLHMISHWEPYLPNTFSDCVILYYTRSSQWAYYSTSETEWELAQTTLKDWISEHKGKQDDDATWTVITIKESEDMTDITSRIFLFMAPSGDFINNDHLSRVQSSNIQIEDINGDTTELKIT